MTYRTNACNLGRGDVIVIAGRTERVATWSSFQGEVDLVTSETRHRLHNPHTEWRCTHVEIDDNTADRLRAEFERFNDKHGTDLDPFAPCVICGE